MRYEFQHGVVEMSKLDSSLKIYQSMGWEINAASYNMPAGMWFVILRRPCSKCNGTGRVLVKYETVEHSHGRESVQAVHAKCEACS